MERNQRTRGRVCTLGAYDPHADRLFLRCADRKDSDAFVPFLEGLRAAVGGGRVYAIMDNVRMHRSGKTAKAFQGLGIEAVWLPTSSPKLNRIEDRFRELQREVIDNSDFQSKEEMVEAIEAYAAYYNGERKRLKGSK